MSDFLRNCPAQRLRSPTTAARATPHTRLSAPLSLPIRSRFSLRPHDAVVQPGYGIERGKDRALLPCREIGGVLASQYDPAIDLAQIAVMLRPRRIGPFAAATQREGNAMPRDGNAVFKFGLVLG